MAGRLPLLLKTIQHTCSRRSTSLRLPGDFLPTLGGFCSGLMIPDTNLGGSIATDRKVFNEKIASNVC